MAEYDQGRVLRFERWQRLRNAAHWDQLTSLNAGLLKDPAFVQRVVTRTALRRWGKPAEIAGAAVFLASDAGAYVTGHQLVVDGGFTSTM